MSNETIEWVTKVLFSSVNRFGWHYPFPQQWITDNFGSVEAFRNEFKKDKDQFDTNGLIWNRIIELDGDGSFEGKGPLNLNWKDKFENDEIWGDAWKTEEIVLGKLYLNTI
jgi:hypothetical protein